MADTTAPTPTTAATVAEAAAAVAATAIDEILSINATDEVVKVATNQNNAIDSHTLANLSHGFNQYISHAFGEFTNNCSDWHWQTPRHIYFQAANALFLIAFLSPHKSFGFLMARCAFVVASILMTMWSYLIECSLDGVVWCGLFLFINFIYLSVLIYQMRPIRFDKEIDAVSFFWRCFITFKTLNGC